jgi:hypothetical protein
VNKEIAMACSIDLPGGRRIWCPPTGRPYWADTSPRAMDLTDEEMDKYFGPDWRSKNE